MLFLIRLAFPHSIYLSAFPWRLLSLVAFNPSHTKLPCSLTQHHGASSTWGPNNFSSFLFIWFALAALGLLSCSCSSVCQQAEASRLYVLACGLFLPECTGVSQPCSGEEGQVVWLLQKGPLRVLLQDKLQPNSSSWPRPLN